MNAPEPGAVVGEFTFQGGDPSKQENWKKGGQTSARIPSDAEQAAASLKGLSLKEFEENNMFMQLGATLFKHLTGQKTEGSLAGSEDLPAFRAAREKMTGEKDVPWYHVPGELVKRFHENPLTTLTDLGKGILYDPELLGVGALRAPSLAAQIVKSAAAGGTIGALQSAAKQSLEKDRVSAGEVAGAATGGAALGGVFSMLGGRAPKNDQELAGALSERMHEATAGVEARKSVDTIPPDTMDTVRPIAKTVDIPSPQPAHVDALTTPPHAPEMAPTKPTTATHPDEAGFADPKLLARMAAVGIGAGAGAYLDKDHPIEGAILGTIGAAIGIKTSPRMVVNKFKELTAPDKRIRISDIADEHESTIGIAGKEIWKLQQQMEQLVPEVERRNAITHWIEGDKSIELSSKEQEAAQLAKGFFNNMKEAGFDADILHTARDNYVTHLWNFGKQDQSAIEAALSKKSFGAGMSPKSPFAKKRTINTIAEGKALGLVPVTEDISQIMGHYGNSLARSIANKQMITSLKEAKTPDGVPLILSSDKAPHTYESINHPQLQNTKIHPDIMPSMKFFFEARNPGTAMRALEGLNTAIKRVAVSFSLFHAKALLDAAIGGRGLKAMEGMKGFLGSTEDYLKTIGKMDKEGHLDQAIKGGLKFSLEGTPGSEDVGGAFYGAMKDLQGLLDQTVPGLGKPVEGLTKINHAVDKAMWARLHAGLKLNTWLEKYETVLENNAKAHQARPDKIALMTKDDAAKIAASFTNDLFGGLNWRRIAESTKTRWGRDLALGLSSPGSRRALQVLMFAPDWTVSTTRAALGAFGKGSGVKGLFEPRTLADLHRQYLARSAIYYAAVGTALNQAFSGHNLWDNKDPTRIDMGDGRTMQWSKHTMEPVHWVTDTRQQMLNKLGFVPRQMAEQALGAEYLSAKGRMPPMKESPVGHLLKGVSPIAVQQNFDAGTSASLAGFFGAPVYGMTPAQRQEAAMRKRLSDLSRSGK